MTIIAENEQKTLKRAKYCLLTIILLYVWDLASSVLLFVYALLNGAICLNDKTQKDICGIWKWFISMYVIYTVSFSLCRVTTHVSEYQKNALFKIRKVKGYCCIISILLIVVFALWILLIVNTIICDKYSTFFYVSIAYISVQLFKEIVFVCIWIYS